MKVVINAEYGGFGLSQEVLEYLHKMECEFVKEWPTTIKANSLLGEDRYYFDDIDNRNAARTDPKVIDAVEKFGEDASGPYSKLKIIDIPFDSTEGWHINEYDGWETIRENHRSWD